MTNPTFKESIREQVSKNLLKIMGNDSLSLEDKAEEIFIHIKACGVQNYRCKDIFDISICGLRTLLRRHRAPLITASISEAEGEFAKYIDALTDVAYNHCIEEIYGEFVRNQYQNHRVKNQRKEENKTESKGLKRGRFFKPF